MTKKETIYNALGMIEGAVCVSQKNTRNVLMKAINMIKDAVEEDADCECNHDWKFANVFSTGFDESGNTCTLAKYTCELCGKAEFRRT